jgi:ribosomal protein L24
MAISKIQTGDNVKIVAGNYRGQTGVVSEVITVTKRNKTIKRVVVSSVPTIVKYKKGNKAAQMPGEQLTTTRKIDASNVMLLNSKGEISKSKVVISDDGKKSRVLKKGDETVALKKTHEKTQEKTKK